MEGEVEMFFKKCPNLRQKFLEICFVTGKDHEIISIADIVVCFHVMLDPLVKLVHVDVYEKLGGEIA